MTASYSTTWAPFAAKLQASLETISSVDAVLEGNLMRNPKYSDKQGSIGFFGIISEPMTSTTNTTLKRIAIGSHVKVIVGICCLSDKPSGSWMAENHWNLVDWVKYNWENNTNFTNTCTGWAVLTEVADSDGSIPFVYTTLEVRFA